MDDAFVRYKKLVWVRERGGERDYQIAFGRHFTQIGQEVTHHRENAKPISGVRC